MAAPLFLPRRSASAQPQGTLRIAPGPLANGLRSAILPGVNRGYDAAISKLPATTGVAPNPAPSGMAGGFGAVQGTGSADKIVTGIGGAFPATGRSYFFRARRNGTGGGGLGRLFDKTNGTSGQYFYVSSSNLTYTEYWNSAERPLSTTVPPGGVWFDVLATSSVSTGARSTNLYVNGVLVATETLGSLGTFNDAAATALTIGNRASDNARNWDGLIACAYTWDRILSADEAAMLSANPWQLFAAPQQTVALTAAAAADNFLLVAPATSAASSTSALTTQIALSASAASPANAGSVLATQIALASNASSPSVASASLTVGAVWAASASTKSTASASLTTAVALAAAAVSKASSTAALLTQVALAAAARATVSSSAQLATQVLLAAAARSPSSASSSLSASSGSTDGGGATSPYVPPSRTVNFDGGTNRVNFDGGTNRVDF